MHSNSHYYILIASGEKLVSNLSGLLKPLASFGCNIIKSKISVMGDRMVAHLFLSGNWGAMAKLIDAISKLESSTRLKISLEPTLCTETSNVYQTYLLEVNGIDKLGSLSKLVYFLKSRKIVVQEITTQTYLAQNKILMSQMSIKIDIPESVQIIRFRDELSDYSELAHLDTFLDILRH